MVFHQASKLIVTNKESCLYNYLYPEASKNLSENPESLTLAVTGSFQRLLDDNFSADYDVLGII